MIEWVVLGFGAAAAGAGFFGYRLAQQGRSKHAWGDALELAAKSYQGRVSLGAVGDPASLRATVDGLDLTLKVNEAGDASSATVEAALQGLPSTLRFAFLYNFLETPSAYAHFPSYEGAAILRDDDKIEIRAEDPAFADGYSEAIALELTDLRRESSAEKLELSLKGGYLRLKLYGIEQSEALIGLMLRATPRLAKSVESCRKPA